MEWRKALQAASEIDAATNTWSGSGNERQAQQQDETKRMNCEEMNNEWVEWSGNDEMSEVGYKIVALIPLSLHSLNNLFIAAQLKEI